MKNSILKTILELLAVLTFYFLASSLMTWPTAMHMNEIVLGGGELGGWLWRYWWHFLEAQALGQMDLAPYEKWRALIALGRYPETGNVLDVIFFSWPLSYVVDFPAHYNLKVLTILTLDGLCGYVLARHFVRGRLVALAAGLLALVNPLVIQDINGSGLRQTILWWLLLYPVFLDRAVRRQRLTEMLLAGVCMGMAAAWYWFYGLFAGLYTILYALWHLLTRRMGVRGMLRGVLPTVFVAVLLAFPFIQPYLDTDEGGGSNLPEMSFFLAFPRYETILTAPMRPKSYEENVLASLHRTIRSSWAADYLVYPTSERTMPIVVFLAGILPALFLRRRPFWLLVLLLFYACSLGPFLKLQTLRDASEVLVLGEQWVIRLPYTLLFRWVPGIARLFAPYRFAAMVVVASVVLVASGLDSLPSSTRKWAFVKTAACILVILAAMLQMTYRFEVQEVPDDSYQPSRWRAPIKVSRIEIPEFYLELDDSRLEGIIELPLEREQDLLCYYQVIHRQRVFRSWATSGALPPILSRGGGGDAGDRLRYLGQQLPLDFPGSQLLERISTHPNDLPVSEIDRGELAQLARAGSFRYMIVHERGYYLANPYHGPVLYRDAVQRLAAGLGLKPDEVVEHAWVDYPGNQYNVPGGPVYIPWTAEEVALPYQEMPRRYYMSIFDLSSLLES